MWYRSAPTAYWHTKETATRTDTSGLQVGCTGGLATRKPDRTETTIHKMETVATGFSNVVPPVNFDVDPSGLYSSSLFVPEIIGDSNSKDTNESMGGCAPFETVTESKGARWPVDRSDALTADGTVAGVSRYVGGSRTIDYVQGAAVPGATANVHTITLRWHLHKFD